LKAAYEPSTLPEGVKAFGISGGGGDGLKKLFMSHPPLDERIEALRAGAVASGLRVG
jgi:heat shock protein HtpX